MTWPLTPLINLFFLSAGLSCWSCYETKQALSHDPMWLCMHVCRRVYMLSHTIVGQKCLPVTQKTRCNARVSDDLAHWPRPVAIVIRCDVAVSLSKPLLMHIQWHCLSCWLHKHVAWRVPDKVMCCSIFAEIQYQLSVFGTGKLTLFKSGKWQQK